MRESGADLANKLQIEVKSIASMIESMGLKPIERFSMSSFSKIVDLRS